jgi:drug/metabolite transporter (DMT)-like permease
MSYLVFAGSIIALSSFVWLMAREPAARVASYAYVNPVVALILGSAFDHEKPTAPQLGGVILVLLGVYLALSGKQVQESLPLEPAA